MVSNQALSIKRLLSNKAPRHQGDHSYEAHLKELQEKMFRAQRALYQQKKRTIIVFEGLDAAGKGGAIRRVTELLDPRGFRVHPIGPPEPMDQAKHWLYRFWKRIPEPGSIAIFDRSWYGRVLVEYVELGLSKESCEEAYVAINNFEKALTQDGVTIIKFFLAISKEEQLKRFEERINNPYKQWKLQTSDIETRKHFDEYVKAIDKMFQHTNTPAAQWHLIAGDDKHHARLRILEIITKRLKKNIEWIENKSETKKEVKTIKAALRELKAKE